LEAGPTDGATDRVRTHKKGDIEMDGKELWALLDVAKELRERGDTLEKTIGEEETTIEEQNKIKSLFSLPRCKNFLWNEKVTRNASKENHSDLNLIFPCGSSELISCMRWSPKTFAEESAKRRNVSLKRRFATPSLRNRRLNGNIIHIRRYTKGLD